MILDSPRDIYTDETRDDPMRRILIVSNGSLLDEAIARLFVNRTDLDVTNMLFEGDDALLTSLDSLKPDTVIIDRSIPFAFERLPSLLASIKRFGHIKLVIVGTDSNTIDVYEKTQIYEAHSNDFLDIL